MRSAENQKWKVQENNHFVNKECLTFSEIAFGGAAKEGPLSFCGVNLKIKLSVLLPSGFALLTSNSHIYLAPAPHVWSLPERMSRLGDTRQD